MVFNKKSKGFTLIELVVVIVILGILSVTAAPKFLNLQSDARKSTMQGIKGSLRAVVDGVYYQSVIQGTDTKREISTDVNGISIQTYYGYPQEIWDNKLEHLMSHSFNYLGNAYQNNSVVNEICNDSMCVVDQIKLNKFMDVSTEAYALAIFPKGHSVTSDCVTAYYFTAPESQGYADVHVDVVDKGC